MLHQTILKYTEMSNLPGMLKKVSDWCSSEGPYVFAVVQPMRPHDIPNIPKKPQVNFRVSEFLKDHSYSLSLFPLTVPHKTNAFAMCACEAHTCEHEMLCYF